MKEKGKGEMYKYFISYYFKGKWNKTGVGSMFMSVSEPINENTIDGIVCHLCEELNVKNVVILYFREIKEDEPQTIDEATKKVAANYERWTGGGV